MLSSEINGWMSLEELDWLRENAKGLTVAEVGSYLGRSTHAIASSAKKVYAIDHWLGQPGVAGGEGVYNQFKHNIREFNNIEIMRTDSVSASKELGDVDMVFLDAGHTYEDVVADIDAWRGKTKFLCGHDYDFTGVEKAVKEKIKKFNVVGSIWYAHYL